MENTKTELVNTIGLKRTTPTWQDVFKKDDYRDFHLVQNVTMGTSDFNPFERLRKQLVFEAENFSRDQNFVPHWDKNNVQRHGRSTQIVHREVEV